MATTPSPDRDTSDAQARLSLESLLGSPIQIGCGACGHPLQEHGRSVIHRFVRPRLPTGYRYLDEVGAGEERALRRRPVEQLTVVSEVTGA